MPAFRFRTTLELVKNLRAFLNLEAGLTRGKIAEPESGEPDRLQLPAREEPSDGGVVPENIIWILGSPRTGSTWLSRILRRLHGHILWDEPFYGVFLAFRDNLANSGRSDYKNFILNDGYREVWLPHLRKLFLDVCKARFPSITPKHYLVVKEPNGSMSAPLIMAAFPESKLVFLTRDGRDVIASLLDARKKEWYPYENFEASLAEATMQGGRFEFPRHESEEEFVEQLARNYLLNTRAVNEAYEKHPDGSKARIYYEDLREKPFEQILEMYRNLGIGVNRERLQESIEEHSWKNIPEDRKGAGKFFRKAKPGSWREDLTPEQAEIVNRILEEPPPTSTQSNP